MNRELGSEWKETVVSKLIHCHNVCFEKFSGVNRTTAKIVGVYAKISTDHILSTFSPNRFNQRARCLEIKSRELRGVWHIVRMGKKRILIGKLVLVWIDKLEVLLKEVMLEWQ
jgi:hypothetical protein